jgi:hypothetical protein
MLLENIKIEQGCCWEILRSNNVVEQCCRGKKEPFQANGKHQAPSTKCASTTAQAPSSQAPSHTEPRTNGKYQRKGSSQAPSPQSTENINGKYQRKRSSTKPHGAKPSVRKHHRLKAPCRLASTIVN